MCLPKKTTELKTKITRPAANIDEDALEKVDKNMEIRICFVMRERGGLSEYLLELKNLFLIWLIGNTEHWKWLNSFRTKAFTCQIFLSTPCIL